MNTDPIADLLTRIRNAAQAEKEKTTVNYSKIKKAILEVMKAAKFIVDFKVVKNGNFQEIEITLDESKADIHLKRISKPGQRIYIKKEEIKPVLDGYGISILSTPKGVMTGREASKNGVGGEYICQIW